MFSSLYNPDSLFLLNYRIYCLVATNIWKKLKKKRIDLRKIFATAKKFRSKYEIKEKKLFPMYVIKGIRCRGKIKRSGLLFVVKANIRSN